MRRTLRSCLVEVLPGVARVLDHSVGDHLHRGVELEVLPLGAVGPAVAHLRLAQRAGDEVLAGGALGTQPAARDRAVGVALDLDDLLVLDEDLLAAPDGAVGAHAAGDAVGGLGAGGDAPRSAATARPCRDRGGRGPVSCRTTGHEERPGHRSPISCAPPLDGVHPSRGRSGLQTSSPDDEGKRAGRDELADDRVARAARRRRAGRRRSGRRRAGRSSSSSTPGIQVRPHPVEVATAAAGHEALGERLAGRRRGTAPPQCRRPP